MDTFTIRDLRERTGELVHDAETGELSIITKHGRPVIIALPFDEKVVSEGVDVALAIKLFQEGVLSIEKAAKFSNCSTLKFTEHLSKSGIPSVDYPADELDEELKRLG